MTWLRGRMALLDFETTGIDSHHDRIVSAAYLIVSTDGILLDRTWLIDPDIEIPEGAEAVHGISTEQAREYGADPSAAVTEIGQLIRTSNRSGIPIVGHNVGYDLTMLCAELNRHGHPGVAAEIASSTLVVDTQIIEKSFDRFRPKEYKPNGRRLEKDCGSHQLVDCCRLWGVPLSAEDAHGAREDALAAGRLAWKLAANPNRFAEYDASWSPTHRIAPAEMTLAQLHAWQVDEYARSAASYQSYVRGEQRSKPDEIDPTFVANTAWPVVPLPAGWTPDALPTAPEAVTV